MQSKPVTLRLFTFLISCILLDNAIKAQQTPPATYSSGIPVSYIRTWDAAAPEQMPNTLMNRALKDVKQSTQYLDGLGRPLQSVLKQGSLETGGSATDLVNTNVYDDLGREKYKYIPFAANNTGGNASINDGLFKMNPFQQQAAFMQQQYSLQTETWFYGQTNFEASPLNRVTETFAPGNSWAGSSVQANEIDRHSVKAKYWTNTATDDIKKWSVTNVTNNWGTYSMTGVYPAGEIFKNVTVDEQGKQIIEYEDKEGKVILKKVQFSAAADNGLGSGYTGWLCIYYIYDDLNNLRCVVQPKGVELLIANSWNITAVNNDILNEQCFRYEYDERNRMVIKKIPGAGETWMVYDVRDRVVLTQDANLRAQGKWMYMLYDEINRPVSSGLWNNTQDRVYHKGQANNIIGYPNLTGQTYEELTNTFYDNYNWLSQYNNPLTSAYSITYDTYFQTVSNTVWPYPQANTQSFQLTGMVTGSRTKILGTSTYLYSVPIYDIKGRTIQLQSTNNTGGTNIMTTQYNWVGQSIITVVKTEKAGTNAQTTVTVTQMTYDDLGRVTKIEKKLSHTLVNSGAMSSFKTVVQNEYDKLGQLKNKKLGPDYNNNAGMETQNFEYNIRGWLLSMNRDFESDANNTKWFGFELGYDKTATSFPYSGYYVPAQFNGNICGTIWKSRGDGVKRKYDYEYDNANRFGRALYTQSSNGTSWGLTDMNYSVGGFDADNNYKLKYDANGNIQGMVSRGFKLSDPQAAIDALRYNYVSNSNKLSWVNDDIVDPNSKLGDFHDGTNAWGTSDYAYDANGNLTLDNNKGISSIAYNYLNLPFAITVTGKGTITYTYDAAGNKLKKITVENASAANNNIQTTTTTTYIGSSVYESRTKSPADQNNPDYTDVLQFIAHEEGRIRPITNAFAYDYFIKDHLGNVRMVLTDEQKQDIYPAATLEGDINNNNTAVGYEKNFYTINSANIADKAEATGITDYANNNGIANPYPAGNSGNANINNNSQKLYKLQAGTTANSGVTGLGITLKVMAGDKIDIFGKSYYFQNNAGGVGANSAIPILDILSGLLGSPGGAIPSSSHETVTASQLNTLPGTTTGISGLFSQQTTESNNNQQRPKAYINYILLDEQFKYVSSNFSPVGSNSVVKNHYSDPQMQNILVTKNGYLYVYVSNESPVKVFFDNLQVVHTRGALMEETHYYPFGMTMAGISSKTLNFGKPENKKKFQGQEFAHKEFTDESGLEMYEFKYRMDDPQIGRFWQIDPFATKYVYNSTYAFSENKVINGIELEGKEWIPVNKDWKQVPANSSDIYSYSWVGFDDKGKPISGSVSNAMKWSADGNGATFYSVNKITNGPQIGYVRIDDQVTSNRIETLHPNIKRPVKELLLRSEYENNQRLRITSAYRGQEDQNNEFAKSKTQIEVNKEIDAFGNPLTGVIAQPHAKWSTNASWGKSYHNYSLAIDVVGFNNNTINYTINWDAYHALGQRLGFSNIGHGDDDHLEFTYGLHWRQLSNLPRDPNGFVILPTHN